MSFDFKLRVSRESTQSGKLQQQRTSTCCACGLVVVGISHSVTEVDLGEEGEEGGNRDGGGGGVCVCKCVEPRDFPPPLS